MLRRQGLTQSGGGGPVERRWKSNPETRQWEGGGAVPFAGEAFPRQGRLKLLCRKHFKCLLQVRSYGTPSVAKTVWAHHHAN